MLPHVDDLDANNSHGEIEEIEDEVTMRFKWFKNFEVVSDPPPFDHHFINHRKSIKQVLLGVSLAEKIQKEWETLETRLPSSIFVRAYENRVDLMRAVVTGPPGTPYHHGLFFFDILFPGDYPAKPPKFFYHSQGFDSNPNSKPEGNVCLSLLGTRRARFLYGWTGLNHEKWNHEKSNLLQVLISIQRLVLSAKPYLNEPVLCESEVVKYKNVFGLTREAMVQTLDSPPKNFEDFVAGHFRKMAHQILMKFKALMDQSESNKHLFLRLLKAFERNGAYCKHHLCWINPEKDTIDEESTNNAAAVTKNLAVF